MTIEEIVHGESKNAVADSCTPQIVPNIELQTIDKKTIIVITVAPGPNRPYYLKSKGKETGTYIRIAGTSRPADNKKIRELDYRRTLSEISEDCGKALEKHRGSVGEVSETVRRRFK